MRVEALEQLVLVMMMMHLDLPRQASGVVRSACRRESGLGERPTMNSLGRVGRSERAVMLQAVVSDWCHHLRRGDLTGQSQLQLLPALQSAVRPRACLVTAEALVAAVQAMLGCAVRLGRELGEVAVACVEWLCFLGRAGRLLPQPQHTVMERAPRQTLAAALETRQAQLA